MTPLWKGLGLGYMNRHKETQAPRLSSPGQKARLIEDEERWAILCFSYRANSGSVVVVGGERFWSD